MAAIPSATMDISAQVLRDVEFSGSLRGYNTDEVDEFLEQVAVGIDRLQAELRGAVEQRGRAGPDPAGAEGEESIRRVLVLAQRTADLAIKEAQEDAALITEQARVEADAVLSEAQDSAERLAADSVRQVRAEVARLTTLRESLKTETDTLASMIDAERTRLTESLTAALRYVERSLTTPAAATSSDTPGATSLSLVVEEGDGATGDVADDGGVISAEEAFEESADSEDEPGDEAAQATSGGYHAPGSSGGSSGPGGGFSGREADLTGSAASASAASGSRQPPAQYDRDPVAMAAEGASEYDSGASSALSSAGNPDDAGRWHPFKRKADL